METFESKIMCMEKKLKNEIDELTSKSTQSKKEIQSSNDNFEDKINKTKHELKIVKNEISQQNQQIENFKKENAKNIHEAKTETDSKNKCMVKRLDGMEL